MLAKDDRKLYFFNDTEVLYACSQSISLLIMGGGGGVDEASNKKLLTG